MKGGERRASDMTMTRGLVEESKESKEGICFMESYSS